MIEVEQLKKRWSDFKIPSVTEKHYGLDYPAGTPQLLIELQGFYYARIGEKKGKFRSAFYHALKICQLLWTDEYVSISRKGCLNTYFLQMMKELCQFNDMAATGPASSGKTYAMAVFFLICFYARCDKTTVLISTTTRQDAERRVWADVKKLHRNARFEENEVPEIGEIIEHMMCVVYNPAKIAGKDFNTRDFRNGLMVIPTGGDSSGEEALNKIMGTKNDFVYWGIDEGPAMPTEIMEPRGNLVFNEHFMFVMIGNAATKVDPHGRACEPIGGWGTIDANQRRWRAKTLNVLFLHGEESPNDIYAPNAKSKKELPYPKLCNRFARDSDALFAGNGDIEYGRNTHHYWRFGIGYWMGSDDAQTCLSEGYIKSHNADRIGDRWGIGRVRVFAGFDPGFAAGGDANAVMFAQIGISVKGKVQCVLESESIEIRPRVTDRTEYAEAVAREVVRLCTERGVQPQDFACDVSADGGITGAAIEKVWGLSGVQLLSSLQPSSAERFANRVSQYWMQVRELISTGAVCGFNINSKYARDLFERRYSTEQKVFKVEKKKEMKKRIHRSPDNGDAFTYMTHLISQSGMLDVKSAEEFARDPISEEIKLRYFTPLHVRYSSTG